MQQFKDIISGSKTVFFQGKQYNGAGVSYEVFNAKMIEIASRLGWSVDWLYAVMFVESAGTFSPSVKNPKSSATGLIQFMEATAKGLGTTTSQLARMNGVDQLEYVYQYFKPYMYKVTSGYDVYLAVFRPAWLTDKTQVIKATSSAYMPNRALDVDSSGSISYDDFIAWVNQRNPQIVGLFQSPIDSTIIGKNKTWIALVALAIAGGFYVSNDKTIKW